MNRERYVRHSVPKGALYHVFFVVLVIDDCPNFHQVRRAIAPPAQTAGGSADDIRPPGWSE
jgi:hypothetical protein